MPKDVNLSRLDEGDSIAAAGPAITIARKVESCWVVLFPMHLIISYRLSVMLFFFVISDWFSL